MCCVNCQVSIKTIQNEILDRKNQNKCHEDLLNMFNDDAVTQYGKFIFKIVSVFLSLLVRPSSNNEIP